MAASPAHAKIGPSVRARLDILRVAQEVRHLSAVAVECCTPGRQLDVARAAMLLDKARALLGPGAGE